METSTISTSTFEAITLQNDTITGASKLIGHFWQTSNARARGPMFCIVLGSLFVLALPTWLSAMTGYTADITAFVEDSKQNLIPAEQFRPYLYTIHDGSRLGDPYTDEYRVIVPWSNDTGVSLMGLGYGCAIWDDNWRYDNGSFIWTDHTLEECKLLWIISRYTSIYGFLGQNDTESLFQYPNGTNVTISKPTLDISAYLAVSYKSDPLAVSSNTQWYGRYSWNYNPYGRYWVSSISKDAPFINSNPMFYYADSGTDYSLELMNMRGRCQQPSQVRYKWGFSFLLLYVFLLTWLIWTIVMYVLFLDSYCHSRLNAAKRQMGLRRAILDLSVAMQKHLKLDDTLMHADSQVSSLVEGTQISYQNIMLDTLPPPRIQNAKFLPWIRREKWWLTAFCVFSLFLTMSWTVKRFAFGWSPSFSAMPVAGILIVLTLARKRRLRWLHFAGWFLPFWVGNIWSLVANSRETRMGLVQKRNV